jgi:hypothetical protein
MIYLNKNIINKIGNSNRLYYNGSIVYQSYTTGGEPDTPDIPDGDYSLPDVPFMFNYNARDYVDGVISSAPISMQDNSKYQMYDLSGSITSIDAVKVFSASVDGSSKFCIILSGESVSTLAPVIGVAIFDTQSGALEKYTEHLPAGKADANIKDICVANGVVYAVGCKVSSNSETNNGVVYTCNLDELLSNSNKNDGTSTKWGAVDTCATELSVSNGEITSKTSINLPALKAVAATAELD